MNRALFILYGVLWFGGLLLPGCPQAPFEVEFYADPLVGDAPMTVNFYDATDTGNATVKSRMWSFGDGEHSSEPSPRHVYAAPGKYPVTLIVDTSKGIGSRAIPNYITVRGKFRVLVRNTGVYPITEFYLALADADSLGGNRIIQPIPAGTEIDLGRDFQQNGYIIVAFFEVDGHLESAQEPFYNTIGMAEGYLLVEAYRMEDETIGLTAVPISMP